MNENNCCAVINFADDFVSFGSIKCQNHQCMRNYKRNDRNSTNFILSKLTKRSSSHPPTEMSISYYNVEYIVF